MSRNPNYVMTADNRERFTVDGLAEVALKRSPDETACAAGIDDAHQPGCEHDYCTQCGAYKPTRFRIPVCVVSFEDIPVCSKCGAKVGL